MNQNKIAAVLTTQFLTDSIDLTVRSLKALTRLPIRLIVIVTDDKEPIGCQLANEAVETMREELQAAEIEWEILRVDVFSTARRWWPGLCKVFRREEIGAALNWPGDLRDDVTAKQIDYLNEALKSNGVP